MKLNMNAEQMQEEILRLREESATAKAEVQTVVFASATSGILEALEQKVLAGRLAPFLRDQILKSFEAQKATFAEGSPLMIPVSLAMTAGPGLPMGESAADAGNPTEQGEPDVRLAQAATELSLSRGVDYGQAVIMAMQLDPDLAAAYKDAPSHAINDTRP